MFTTLPTKRALARRLVIAAASVAVLTACSGGDEPAGKRSQSASPEGAAHDVAADLVGPGCAEYVDEAPDGAGSIEAMADAPASAAVGTSPELTTFAEAVAGELNPEVDLRATLEGKKLTIFAPVDDAFAKLPKESLEALGTKDAAATLESVLEHHIVAERLDPADVVGSHQSEGGDAVEVSGEGDSLTVDDAHVVCGGIQTSNATIYLLDTVLMPPS